MKRSYFALPTLFLCAFISFLCLKTYPAETSQKYAVVKNGINIRIDSTVQSHSLGKLRMGERVDVLAEKFSWYKIKLPKRFNCYIAKELIKKIDNKNVVTKGKKINLRASPSLEAYIIGKAPKGVNFSLIAETQAWVKVQGYPYMHGWVHKQFLKDITQEIGLELFVKKNISNLSELNMPNKKLLHQEFIAKGEKIIPLLQKYIYKAKNNTSYSIIFILTQLGKINSELSLELLSKVCTCDIKASSIYLDVAQNILIPNSERIAYFYLAQENKLSGKDVKEAAALLKKEYEKINQKSE